MPFTSTNIEEDLVVAPGQTFSFSPSNQADTTAFWLVNAPYNAWAFGTSGPNVLMPDLPTLINYGDLVATDTAPAQQSWGVNLLFIDGSAFWTGVTVENHGLMSAFSQHSEAFAFRASSWSPSILNTGRMIAEAPEFYAVAISSYGQNLPTPFSSGWSIQNTAGGELIAIGDIANAVRTPFANFFNNGLVRAEGGSVEGVGVWANGGNIENSGQIVALADVGARAIGIALGLIDAFNGPRDTTIVNSGLIHAATAIDEQYDGGVSTSLINSGRIEGNIILFDGDDVITNFGEIVGNIQLGAGADTYNGRNGSLQGALDAGAGDDLLVAGTAGGVFHGGAGNDLAVIDLGSTSAPVQYAHSDAQAILTVGGAATVILSSLERIDITCGTGFDEISGSALDDTIRLGLGGGVADGGGGIDFVSLDFSDQTASVVYSHVNSEAQVLIGGGVAAVVRNAESVEIVGGASSDTLSGGTGDDILVGGAEGDVLIGDAGFDTVSFASSSAGVAVTLGGSATGGDASGDTLLNIESLIGSSHADSFVGDASANILDGGAGADVLQAGLGDDIYVVDQAGDVVIENANGGFDTVHSFISMTLGANIEALALLGAASINAIGNGADNVLLGNDGDNLFVGGGGADNIDGGDGYDTASYASCLSAVNVSLATGFGSSGDAEGDFLNHFEGLVGSPFDDVLVGNFLNNAIEGGAGADQIDGADGADVVVYSNSNAEVSVNLLTGFCTGGEANGDFLLNVEGIRGSAFNDELIGGNSGVNWLNGGAGDDMLVSGYATGRLDGGEGFDTVSYSFMVSAITVDLTKSQVSQFPYVFDTLSNVERIIGSGFNDLFIGDEQSNWFDGGLGADVLIGGAGNDTYVVDTEFDALTELAGEGTDLVQSTITWFLGAELENLSLIGAAAIGGSGNELANAILGNAAINSLFGNGGNDNLDGGLGADAMFGGAGDDTYVVDNTGDVTFEGSALDGIDSVFSSVTRTLGANLENLTLTGALAIVGNGNALANIIIGNASANTLFGNGGNDALSGAGGNDILHGNAGNDNLDGGIGADTMYGEAGDDTYVVDSGGDITFEGSALDGIDSVFSSVTRALGPNLENLTLTGAAAINGGGNGLANILIGNNAVNALFGNGGNDTLDGGQGGDKMYGVAGDDTYVVDNAGDVTFEGSALDGTDLVLASVTRSLGANLENLTLTGTAAINGIGNSLGNTINGNSGANQLFGNLGDDVLAGGAGNDLLAGGAGNDAFVFAPGSGSDTVTTFLAGGIDDTLDFSAYNGTGITWTITQVGANTVFDFTNGDQITLTNVIAANLVQTDPFGFG